MKIKTSLNTTEGETHSYTCYKKHLNANTYTQLFDFSMSVTYWGSRGPSSSWCSWVSGFANKPLKTLTSTKRNCDHWMQPNSANVFVYDCIQPISLCRDSNSKHMLFLVHLSLYVQWLYEPCLLVVQGVLADLLHLSALPDLACHPIHVVQ